jgi:hypothetical protein
MVEPERLEQHDGDGLTDESGVQPSEDRNGYDYMRFSPTSITDYADVALDPFNDLSMVGFEPDGSVGIGDFTTNSTW